MAADNQSFGLGLKLILVECGRHKQSKVFKQMPDYVESAKNLNCEIVMAYKIAECFSSALPIRYSTILILINCRKAGCREKSLLATCGAIKRNRYLRNLLKVICTSYVLDRDWTTPGTLCDLMFPDFFYFMHSQLENSLLFQDNFETQLQTILLVLSTNPFITAQEMHNVSRCLYLATALKSNGDLFFYGVNPALAVIINGYYFTNSGAKLDVREGSEKDVLDLMYTFEINRTPYICLEDLGRAELLGLQIYLRNKNLKHIKNIYFFTMTHGIENFIIYTHDGQLNFIDDILRPIQSNPSLNETYVTFINVHCRGALYACHADFDEFEGIKPTKIEHLKPNTAVVLSVPDLTISPRHPKTGTPLANSFTKSFDDLDSPSNLETLYGRILDKLEDSQYYQYLTMHDKYAELVVGDGTQTHCIKPLPTSPKDMVPMLASIQQDFRSLPLKGFTESPNTVASPSSQLDSTTFCLYANKGVKENLLEQIKSQLKLNEKEDDDEDEEIGEAEMEEKVDSVFMEFQEYIVPLTSIVENIATTVLHKRVSDEDFPEDLNRLEDFGLDAIRYQLFKCTMAKKLEYLNPLKKNKMRALKRKRN